MQVEKNKLIIALARLQGIVAELPEFPDQATTRELDNLIRSQRKETEAFHELTRQMREQG